MANKVFRNDQKNADPVYLVRADGYDTFTYTLASNVTLAVGASTAPVTIAASGSYGLSYSFAGSASMKLQTLGPDGATWIDIATVTASGSQQVNIFAGSAGAPLRWTNSGSAAATSLYSTVAS